MLGFSIQKLLFTAIAIAAVWYGFKWLGRVQERNKQVARERARRMKAEATQGGAGRATAGARANPDVEEMVECPTCGAFVAATGASNCGKSRCPYTG